MLLATRGTAERPAPAAAGSPVRRISVGSTISLFLLFLSPWDDADSSARTATTGTSSRAADSAVSAACSLPCPARYAASAAATRGSAAPLSSRNCCPPGFRCPDTSKTIRHVPPLAGHDQASVTPYGN